MQLLILLLWANSSRCWVCIKAPKGNFTRRETLCIGLFWTPNLINLHGLGQILRYGSLTPSLATHFSFYQKHPSPHQLLTRHLGTVPAVTYACINSTVLLCVQYDESDWPQPVRTPAIGSTLFGLAVVPPIYPVCLYPVFNPIRHLIFYVNPRTE